MKKCLKVLIVLGLGLIVSSCDAPSAVDKKFTIAVIPDTQNYLDFTRQTNEGFGIDGADLFLEQMEYIAANTVSQGGEIEFVTSVGDVWQNYDRIVDPAHYERGMRQIAFPERFVRRSLTRSREETLKGVREFEVPLAKRGYDIIAETGVPFSVVPGNHDYDTWWMNDPDAGYVDDLERASMHVGGYTTFNGTFGPDTPYFKDKDWYISSYNGGVNSAQIFEAGGYKFLHFGFEMQAGDDVLEWAQSIIDQYPGLPTIMSTHDFLSARGERGGRTDYTTPDPDWHNLAEDVWNEWIRNNDQIFLILSGHQPGQATRVDKNDAGYEVYQILSDYQARQMAVIPPIPADRDRALGDGWMRLMNFDFSADVPKVDVRTYSTHYKKYSIEMPEYAQWYREREQPNMTDAEFNAADHFTIELVDFKVRFGER